MSISSMTECIRRFAARSRWPRRYCTSCAARKALGWPATVPAPVIDPAACCRQFNINPSVWEYICQWGIMFYDRTYPARYDSSHRIEMKVVFAEAHDRIHAGASPNSVGLANIGLPEPVPAATSKQIRGEE